MQRIQLCRGGVNISDKNRVEVYLSNAFVALSSAKAYNPDSEVALITNIDLPPNFRGLFDRQGISIYKKDFDSFRFPEDYRWGLAFYKLCALEYVTRELSFSKLLMVDTDVYFQSSCDAIFEEAETKILMFDINEGLKVNDYKMFVDETFAFSGVKNPTRYGGEFFAANRENAIKYIAECKTVYQKMIEEKFYTRFGDEFISAIACDSLRPIVKNAGGYVFRYWTGDFRLVSTNYKYNPVTVLHVPGEKNRGMIKLFKYIRRKGNIPSNSKVHSWLHLKRRSFERKVKILIKTILGKM